MINRVRRLVGIAQKLQEIRRTILKKKIQIQIERDVLN
jgi:hypothetical protein